MAWCEFELLLCNWGRVTLSCTCPDQVKGMSSPGLYDCLDNVVLALDVLSEPMVIHSRRAMRLLQIVRAIDVYWPRLRLCVLDVSRTRDTISGCTFAVCYGCAALCMDVS